MSDDLTRTIALMRVSESVTLTGPALANVLAEMERLHAIEQRAIHVRDEDLAYDGGPEALYILGEA